MTVALLDLRPNDCRFPIDDLFCAAARREGSSYCDHHHGLAYVTAGRRAFSSGGFMAEYTEKVAPARPARAHETVNPDRTPPATAMLDQFVRAAAARRHDAPQYPAPLALAALPRPQVRVVAVQAYVAPRSTGRTHEANELFYLADLARQCASIVSAREVHTLRGQYYAIYLRDFIAGALDMSTDELLCNRRTKDLVRARQFAMFCVAKGALKLSLPALGRDVFGGFDHTTVLHARDKIGRMIADGTLPYRLTAILHRICEFDPIIADAVRKLRAPRLEVVERETA